MLELEKKQVIERDKSGWTYVRGELAAGYVPDRVLRAEPTQMQKILRAFTATGANQLTIEVGDEVQVQTEHASGWDYVKNKDGEKGWVPHSSFKPPRKKEKKSDGDRVDQALENLLQDDSASSSSGESLSDTTEDEHEDQVSPEALALAVTILIIQ